ncbi:hypothetical protein DFH09DRAFT_1076988 [Mycena vulgaris]|nr:hypothetical protein DFH09DRAFT_1076988 [Mycena vulgaris]
MSGGVELGELSPSATFRLVAHHAPGILHSPSQSDSSYSSVGSTSSYGSGTRYSYSTSGSNKSYLLAPSPLCSSFVHALALYSIGPPDAHADTLLPSNASYASYNSTSTSASAASGTHKKKWWPLGGTKGWTSDAGWGCMLRTSQSLLATALQRVGSESSLLLYDLLIPRSSFGAGFCFPPGTGSLGVWLTAARGVFGPGGGIDSAEGARGRERRVPATRARTCPRVYRGFIPRSRSSIGVWGATPCNSFGRGGGFGVIATARGGSVVFAPKLPTRRSTRGERPSLTPASAPLFPPTSPTAHAAHAHLVSWFLDAPAAPFGVHRMALAGKAAGKNVGMWFGPSAAAGALGTLVGAYPVCEPGVNVATHVMLYKTKVLAASYLRASSAHSSSRGHRARSPASAPSSGHSHREVHGPWAWGDRLVLLRLGIRLNPVYHEMIKMLYTFPQSVGITDDHPLSSNYFVGVQGNGLLHLDPHHSRPAIPLRPFMGEPAPPPTHDDRRSLGPEAYARGNSVPTSRAQGH